MGWNIKKIKSKINDFFKDKKIEYSFEENKLIYRFELALSEANIMIYPYITVLENDIISFNINICEVVKKNYDYLNLNNFNIKSKYLKAMITEDSVITLEYRFLMFDEIYDILDHILNEIYILQKDIDLL